MSKEIAGNANQKRYAYASGVPMDDRGVCVANATGISSASIKGGDIHVFHAEEGVCVSTKGCYIVAPYAEEVERASTNG